MKCRRLLERIDELNNQYVLFWQDICNIESPTDFKEGVDKVGEYFVVAAKKRGWLTEIHKEEISGNAVCITMNPTASGKPIALSGHMDTVHPIGSFGSPAVTLDYANDKIYGPGVFDCKGGIAAAFLAMAALEDVGFDRRPVMLLLQSDEEVSSRDSEKRTINYICEKAKDCEAFLNMEGHTCGKAILIRKGISRYAFEVTGKAAHSSRCYNGASAILEACYKITELEKFKDPDGITCNCGKISGGTAENTVPESCTFTVDVRFSTAEQKERMDRLCEEIAQKSFLTSPEGTALTHTKLTLKSRRVSMELNDKNKDLLDRMNTIYVENALPALEINASTGGSDAADATAFGITTVDNLGTQGGELHSRNEFCFISSLAESAKRVASVIYCL